MSRVFVLLALSIVGFSFVSGSALACEEGKCSKGHCDMPASPTAALPADGTHVKLSVAGMHCGACADKVKTALIGVDGVKGAVVDAATGVAEVAYDSTKATHEKLVAAVAATGKFTATVATN